jgi:exonuclease SbcC
MIKSVELQNFRSHKQTKINFDDGINAIVGSSGRGKTQILRALYWVKDNKPDGLSYISHFNRDKKGLPIEPTIVSIELENKIYVIRERSKEFNGYRIKKGKEIESFDAMNGKVPDQVSSLLNLGDVNVQKQLDAPFLLSGSAGEAARYFNAIIHLDMIDDTLSRADVKHRKLVSNKKEMEKEFEDVNKKITDLGFIEDAKLLLEKIEFIQKEIDELKTKKTELESIREQIIEWDAVTEYTKEIIKAEPIIEQIEDILENKQRKEKERKSLINIKSELEKVENDLDIGYNIDEVNNLIEKIECTYTIIKENKQRRKDLKTIQEQLESYDDFLRKNNKYILEQEKKLEKLIPDECPWCHQSIDKKHFMECSK